MESLLKTPGVNAFDRIVGGFAARWPRALRRLGDLESRVLASDISSVRIDRPVFVCGLARSGTTLLLELVAAAPGFTSHRYSDYPLLWTPYWWNWLRARLPLPAPAPVERAHRDRLTVTPDSPEAFEEVLWMHFFPRRHDPGISQVLDACSENAAFEAFYAAHIRKLLAVRGARRYVAKGNYNLSRIGYLQRLFPDARFIIAIREPLAHVASLVKQDRLFSELARADPAVATHLARTGHFEFGPGKRAVHLRDAAQAAAIGECFDAGRVAEGYARQWAASYGWLAQRLADDPKFAAACHVVSYEGLCAEPESTLSAIYARIGVDASVGADLLDRRRISVPDYYSIDFNAAERASVEGLTKSTMEAFVKIFISVAEIM